VRYFEDKRGKKVSSLENDGLKDFYSKLICIGITTVILRVNLKIKIMVR